MKRVLFLHGWFSDGGTKTMFMRSLGYNVTTPRLSDWSFSKAVVQAQAAYDEFRPDVIVGSSRGGAVAMNMDSGDTPMILLAPAWKRWGKAAAVKKNAVVIHSPHDDVVPFEDSVELCCKSGARLIAAGEDHRLNDRRAMDALANLLWMSTGSRITSKLPPPASSFAVQPRPHQSPWLGRDKGSSGS